MVRWLNCFFGLALGLVALELSLRLTTYEHEADGNYWGRDAFVADEDCGYRHAPSTVATLGRRGVFGPLTVRTNADGYRDRRPIEPGPDSGPRLMIIGASFMFGLGVEDDEALFAAQLERRLRERDDLPDDLEVLNVSQAGYLAKELEALGRREVPRAQPAMVLLVLTPAVRFTRLEEGVELDVLHGYRLPSTRPGRGSWVDALRTDSWAFMRTERSPLLEASAYFEGAGEHSGPDPGERSRGTKLKVPRHVVALSRFLERRDIAFLVMVVYRPWQKDKEHWLGKALAPESFAVHELDTPAEWVLGSDGHWTAEGHAAAAALMAPRLPAQPFRQGLR